MAHTSRIVIILAAIIVTAACNKQPTIHQPANTPSPAANTYNGTGVVKSINTKAPAIEIDHGDIGDLMPAMQMEFPVSDASLLNGIAVNDHIDFTVEANKGEMKVIAIKKK